MPHKLHSGNRSVHVVARGRVVLFEVAHDLGSEGVDTTSYACYRPTRERTMLTNDLPETGGFGRRYFAGGVISIAGEYTAYAWDDGDFTGVALVDARTGVQSVVDIYDTPSWQRFKRVLQKASGRVAWSQRGRIRVCRTNCLSETPAAETVANSRQIEPRSLRGTRSGIAWLEGSRRHIARLP